MSLSARRAWIEIAKLQKNISALCVALRKESVDRNAVILVCVHPAAQSLSARRAWIEIHKPSTSFTQYSVALRKESVDRNIDIIKCATTLGVALRKESVDRNWIGK